MCAEVADVVTIILAAVTFSRRPCSWNREINAKRHNAIRPFVSAFAKILTNARRSLLLKSLANLGALQYAEDLSRYSPDVKPWAMQGALLSAADITACKGLLWHEGICHTLALRLAILYDAPVAVQTALIKASSLTGPALEGTLYGSERSFLLGIYAIRHKGDPDQITASYVEMRRHQRCKQNI